MYLGNVVAVILVLLTVPIFAALMQVPFFIIAPMIVIICTVGAYSVSNSYLDVVMMMGFGILGLSVQEASLSAGATGARDRHRRQGGRRVPPIDAYVEGVARNIFRQYAGDDLGAARRGISGGALDLANDPKIDGTIAGAAVTMRGATARRLFA
jgi:hypothetical protein